MMNILKKTLREPLLHFLVIGAGLFLLFSFINGPAVDKPNRIVVSNGQVVQLADKLSWYSTDRADSPDDSFGNSGA